jgi:hypothetical protein
MLERVLTVQPEIMPGSGYCAASTA